MSMKVKKVDFTLFFLCFVGSDVLIQCKSASAQLLLK